MSPSCPGKPLNKKEAALQSRILQELAPRYDAIVESIYRAGSGLEPWLKPLADISEIFQSWSVQLLGVNKLTGVMSFSYEAGSAPPEAPVEYLRYYHRVDPRLGKHLPAPAGEWFSCEEHFDERFVETNPFYQDYLIPMGGRYLYGAKLHDDASSSILIGNLSRVGNPPLAPDEKEAFARLADHFRRALDIQQALADRSGRQSVGIELLEKMRQPMVLIDSHRRITYRNAHAAALLTRKDLVYELDGQLVCRNPEADIEFSIALRELALVPISTHGDMPQIPPERRSLRLTRDDGRRVAAALLALRPAETLGGFGSVAQALFTLFEPGTPVDIDPFLLSTTFGLTPAEARLAAMIVNGRSPEECARELKVKISTVRTQLTSTFRKTGASGQSDLIRLILAAASI